jgi:multidrug efflux system membrane fusion protein
MNDLSESAVSGVSDNALQSRAARRRRNVIRAAIIIVALLSLIIWIIYRSESSQTRPSNGPFGRNAPVAVAIASAAKGDMSVTIPALGTVTPLATVTVKTQISGQLTQVAFKEGQMVHAGDFLAQIDPRPYQAALDQAIGNQRRDQALLANAKVDLMRYQALVAEDSIARQQLDTQTALVEQYQGTVVGDEAAIATAKLNLQYAHIVSPVSGRVGLRQVDAGNYVTPADASGLVVVTQLQPITVIFPVPEDNVSTIVKRLHDGATLTVSAFDRTNTNKLADGKLLTVDNQIDATTGTIKLRAEFDNKDGLLFANQFVNVQLLLDVLHDQVIVPSAAIHHGTANGVPTAFVYLVKPDHTVTVRPVTLGVTDGERVAVPTGLPAGDIVVTEGGDRLREGAQVILPGAPPRTPIGNPLGKSK